MYSVMPAIVALIFLSYGFYAVYRKGFTRISTSFFVLCTTTFFWQFTWAILFQVDNADTALMLIKFGYLLILFLPTSMYHFLAEICERKQELSTVYLSYGFAGLLGVFLLGTNLFVSGYYEYFWGFYPKAGPLLILHVLQTTLIAGRCLIITYKSQKAASYFQRTRLQYCFFSVLMYLLAAVDYLCNYGFEFYPPGVIFISISLGIMAVAIVKYRLMDNPIALAASLAHQIRTPLLTIRMQAKAIDKYWPVLFEGYQLAVKNNLIPEKIRKDHFKLLGNLAQTIEQEVNHSNYVIDMMLASTHEDFESTHYFSNCSIKDCLEEAISRYTFNRGERDKVSLDMRVDFEFFGSHVLIVYVLFNLIKNSLYAIKSEGKGGIFISLESDKNTNRIIFTDTASGINEDILPHIFDNFFTTKRNGSGTGIGLAFCKQVMNSIKGDITCSSRMGEYTTFVLTFPQVKKDKPRLSERYQYA